MDEVGGILIAVGVISCIAGGIVGHANGRGFAGFVLGLFLGPFGVVAVAAMPPSMAVRYQRDQASARSLASAIVDVLKNPDLSTGGVISPAGNGPVTPMRSLQATSAAPRGSDPSEGVIPTRLDLIAEAIRRDPTLNDSENPVALRRLNAEIEELAVEYRTKVQLEALLRAESAKEQAVASQKTSWNPFGALSGPDERLALIVAQDATTPDWALRRYLREGRFESVKDVIRERLASSSAETDDAAPTM